MSTAFLYSARTRPLVFFGLFIALSAGISGYSCGSADTDQPVESRELTATETNELNRQLQLNKQSFIDSAFGSIGLTDHTVEATLINNDSTQTLVSVKELGTKAGQSQALVKVVHYGMWLPHSMGTPGVYWIFDFGPGPILGALVRLVSDGQVVREVDLDDFADINAEFKNQIVPIEDEHAQVRDLRLSLDKESRIRVIGEGLDGSGFSFTLDTALFPPDDQILSD